MAKKYVKKFIFSTLVIAMASTAFANQEQQRVNEHLADQRIQDELYPKHQNNFKTSINRDIFKKNTNNLNRLVISKEELTTRPDLVIRGLLAAVKQGNTDNVALLFPIYQKFPSKFKDTILTQWAEAILAKNEQNYDLSIRSYRKLLSTTPHILPAQLQLAIVLFENNELEAAENQFYKLRAEPIPNELQLLIIKYLNAIQQRDRWTFSGGVTYLNDPNINNAPKSTIIHQGSGILKAEPAESAEGIGFNFDIGKKWSWRDGFFNDLNLSTDGKYYWNNKKYNEVSISGRLGIGYQNGKMLFSISPFMTQVLYGGGSKNSETLKRFSKSTGITLNFNYWLSPKWQFTNSYEYAEQRYSTRKHLNGNYHSISTGLIFYANAQRRLFTNLNYQRNAARDKDDSFFRRGITLGWLEEWNKGLSTRFSASLAQKRHKGPIPFFGVIQRKEYGFQASVWHRAVHYWGITPRLTYSFNKTRANHPFYSYDKHKVFIDFSKQF
ncbi:hypothetical protein A6A11_00105 [Bisgaardia hudsonensis]|nr:hypothetical protein A6A11_00105 [Bisgaardia hudsonensis]